MIPPQYFSLKIKLGRFSKNKQFCRMKELPNLPLGVQTFLKMRSGNYVYVDKTEHIYRIASKTDNYFLSRPRRFGKSLTVSTLKELFEATALCSKVCGLTINGIGR